MAFSLQKLTILLFHAGNYCWEELLLITSSTCGLVAELFCLSSSAGCHRAGSCKDSTCGNRGLLPRLCCMVHFCVQLKCPCLAAQLLQEAWLTMEPDNSTESGNAALGAGRRQGMIFVKRMAPCILLCPEGYQTRGPASPSLL